MKKICALKFFNFLKKNGIEFFCGVPDSVLESIIKVIQNKVSEDNHVIVSNEGNSIGLACGYYLATKKLAMVYLQNSGLGNAINPLTSLVNKETYSIPMLMLIGWRGDPYRDDEPQHSKPGKIMLRQLKLLDIKYLVADPININKQIVDLIKYSKKEKKPVSLIVKRNDFDDYELTNHNENKKYTKRSDAVNTILNFTSSNDAVISTTGYISRQTLKYIHDKKISDKRFFFNVGAMGHLSSIALGIALKSNKRIICIDGDGSFFMHMGNILTISNYNLSNLKYFLINNGAHESVGGQRTLGLKINLEKIVKSFGFQHVRSYDSLIQMKNIKKDLQKKQSCFFEIKTDIEKSANLPRPKKKLKTYGDNFSNFLRKCNV